MITLVGGNLYQWDTGRVVSVVSDNGSIIHEVHFTTNAMTFAYVVKTRVENAATYCSIPNILLQQSNDIYCYEVKENSAGEESVSTKVFPVQKRNRPEDYTYTEQEQITIEGLQDQIDAIKEYLEDLNGPGSSDKNSGLKVYCWGDSLTQGEGSNLKLTDGVFNSFNLHPYTNELTNFQAINLGCQGENVVTIMARQGADPMVVGGFTIPAECTPVAIGTNTAGIPTASGEVAKPLNPMEAGINPCTIAGVKGILHRGSSQNNSDDNYYFTRLEAGDAVTVPSNSEITTFAMANYRNGIAVIWMGANGGWSNVSDFIAKVQAMIEYGTYSNYLLLICREFSGNDVATISNAFTDTDGTCHVLYLYDKLAIHGLTLANMVHYYFDTSSYANGDQILLKAPMLCECTQVNGSPKFGGLHFSAYGYKAIGKLVANKLTELLPSSTSGGSGGGGSGGGSTGGDTELSYTTNVTDSHGLMLWKLTKPYTSNGSKVIDTKWAPYDEDKNWTIAIKVPDTIKNVTDYGSIFESRDDTVTTSLYFRKSTIDGETCYEINVGKQAGFKFKKTGGFFEWVGGDFSTDGYHYLVVSKSGDSYIIAFDGGIWDGYGAPLGDARSDWTLMMFARRMPDSTFGQYVKGEITDFRIYDTNLSATECQAIITEMQSSTVTNYTLTETQNSAGGTTVNITAT